LSVHGLFALAHLIPEASTGQAGPAHITWNYTSVLDAVFGTLAVVLLVVFFRTGGPRMLQHMKHHEH
jgi:hypothetical protein